MTEVKWYREKPKGNNSTWWTDSLKLAKNINETKFTIAGSELKVIELAEDRHLFKNW